MMLCNDVSSGLSAAAATTTSGSAVASGQSHCSVESLPLSAKQRDAKESVLDRLGTAFLSTSRPNEVTTPKSQGNWQKNYIDQQFRSTDRVLSPRPEDSDAEKGLVDRSPMLTSEIAKEMGKTKRTADCTGLQNPSHLMMKKMKLSANPLTSNPGQVTQFGAPIQEHWKREALSMARFMPLSSSQSIDNNDVTKCSKDDLLHCLNRLDVAIIHDEMTLAKLRNTLEQLQDSVAKSSKANINNNNNNNEDLEREKAKECLKRHLNQAETVLEENRRKAEMSHAFLSKMEWLTESSLYQQPSDTAVYHENKHKFMAFKKRLIAYIKNKNKEQNLRSKRLSEWYDKLHLVWKEKLDSIERSQEPRMNRVHEYFDKVFPDMKKQGEENIQRICSSILASSDLEESLNGLKEETLKPEVQMEMVMKKLKSLAADLPPLIDRNSRQMCFLNENGLVEDPTVISNASLLKNSFWTEHERDVFTEKYIRHPKKFGLISSFLENKTIQDCVQFYYMTKKEVGYKKLHRQRYSKKSRIRGQTNNAKEDKPENKNSENQVLGPVSTNLETEPAKNKESAPFPTSVEANLVGQESNGKPSDPPSTGTLSSQSDDIEKVHKVDNAVKTGEGASETGKCTSTGQNLLGKSEEGKNHPVEWKECQEKPHDLAKADDEDSIATLSADEVGAHGQDDDCQSLTEKYAKVTAAHSKKKQATVPAISPLVTATLCPPKTSLDGATPQLYPGTANSTSFKYQPRKEKDESFLQTRPSSRGRDEKRSKVTGDVGTKNDFQGMGLPVPADLGERSKTVPNLLLYGSGTSGSSPRLYSPLTANHYSGSSHLPIPRNTSSPTRIRDLIHAAIEKNLQTIDAPPAPPLPPPPAARHTDQNKFMSSNDLSYQATPVVETLEAQDLSTRSSRRVSADNSTVPAKVLPPKTIPSGVQSPYHLLPAHVHLPEMQRTGHLLDLAVAADLSREKSPREATLAQYEMPLAGIPPFIYNPGIQTQRQREELVHKGSIMQGTPIPSLQNYHTQATFPAENLVKNFKNPAASKTCNPAGQLEPIPWTLYPQLAPYVSTEREKLLLDDFLTAQQMNRKPETPLIADRHIRPHNPHQDLSLAFPRKPDPYVAEALQPLKTAAKPSFHGTDERLLYLQPHPSYISGGAHGYVIDTVQHLLPNTWVDGNRAVAAARRNNPADSQRRSFRPEVPMERSAEPAHRHHPTRLNYSPVSRFESSPSSASMQYENERWSHVQEEVNWPKLSEGCSAAQLIEAIIYTQISKPDADEKIRSSILNRIDETNSASLVSYAESEYSHPPAAGSAAHRSRSGRDEPKVVSRSSVPEKMLRYGDIGEKISERGIPPITFSDQSYAPSLEVIAGKGHATSRRGFTSGTEILEKSFPSNMGISDRPIPSLGLLSSDARSLGQQTKRKTVGENFDAIIEEAARQSYIDNDQNAVRTLLTRSDPNKEERVQSKADGHCLNYDPSKSRDNLTSAADSRRMDSDVRDSGNLDYAGKAVSCSGQTSTGFNWKTKILREHQKQQRENQDTENCPKSNEMDEKSNGQQFSRRLSSDSSLSNGDVKSSDGLISVVSSPRLPSPADGRNTRDSAGDLNVIDDHQSAIAASHQVMSTLLSGKSGTQPGRNNQPSSNSQESELQTLNQAATAEPLVSTVVTPGDQPEKPKKSPTASLSKSSDLDSPESELPGRLVIRMDSADDLRSSSPVV